MNKLAGVAVAFVFSLLGGCYAGFPVNEGALYRNDDGYERHQNGGERYWRDHHERHQNGGERYGEQRSNGGYGTQRPQQQSAPAVDTRQQSDSERTRVPEQRPSAQSDLRRQGRHERQH